MRVATEVGQEMERFVTISIHATHAGGDLSVMKRTSRHSLFQSTPPMRVATSGMSLAEQEGFISIHATHAGGDRLKAFQSTPPMRVATDPGAVNPNNGARISIHATHAGGDHLGQRAVTGFHNFNPRHPCGWRPAGTLSHVGWPTIFQSTPPMRVATSIRCSLRPKKIISIHATHAGGDYKGLLDLAYRSGISIHATHAGGDT